MQEELSRLLVEEIQDSSSGLITITRVEMSPDLKTAYIYLSIFGGEQKETTLELLDEKKGYLRKSIASKVKLKYNPLLIFSFDPNPDYESKIDKLLENIRKDEK